MFVLYDGKTDTSSSTKTYTSTDEEYTRKIEIKLENLINEIDGVSNAKVMIMLKSGFIYAINSNTDKTDTSFKNNDLNSNDYLPEIEGVAIVCDGGNNAVVKEKITELICSVLGLYSTHIYVTE